ncbi:MAG: hypothetical protein ACK4P2_01820, partial [Hyphomonas sp.]
MRQIWMAGGAALCIGLAGCGDPEIRRGEPYVAKPPSQEARDVLGDVDPAGLPASQRAALAYAHAVTAAALFRAGETDAGDLHAAHLDAEIHPGLMVGLDTLGFDAAPLGAVTRAPPAEGGGAGRGGVLGAGRPPAA